MNLADVLNILDIVQRAGKHQALTPSERAWLKMMKGIGDAVLFAVAGAVVQFFAAQQDFSHINWQAELLILGTLALKAYKDARSKWASAQAPQEAQAGNILGSVASGNGEYVGS